MVVAIVVSGSGHDIVFSCGVLACDDHMSQKFVGQKGVVLLIIALQDLPISLSQFPIPSRWDIVPWMTVCPQKEVISQQTGHCHCAKTPKMILMIVSHAELASLPPVPRGFAELRNKRR